MDRFRRLLLDYRRPVAAVLAGLAVLTALASVRTEAPQTAPVVVAARDLPSGARLTADDVRLLTVPPDLVAGHAITTDEDVVGRRLSGPMRSGETITDARLLGPGALLGRDSDVVVATVRVADPVELEPIGVGELVDLVAVAADGRDTGPSARVVAEGLEVVATHTDEDDPTGTATLRVAVEREAALRLAEASVETRMGVLAATAGD